MKYIFLFLVTFKIIKKKLTKLQEAMGFQTSHSNKKIAQPIFKAKEESRDAHHERCSLFVQRTVNSISDHNVTNSGYASWVVKHPSALSSFDSMMKAAIGKKIVVFLDYDGTLSPIVSDPDRAFMSDEMRKAVSEVATYFPTAIISGRSRDKVKDFVKLNNLYYAGSHGMDIMVPSMPIKSSDGSKHCDNIALNTNGNDVPFQPAKKFLPAIREILRRLENGVKEIEGAKVEDNGFCISVHFRHVQEKDYYALEEKVKSVLEKNPQFCLTEGKKVMEIRPAIKWNKGNAVEYFLDSLGLSNSNNILPLYIGDDKTDEDAFKVIQRRGQGFPIIVSSIPKETKALYSLHDPSEVLIFLSRLAKWKKSSS